MIDSPKSVLEYFEIKSSELTEERLFNDPKNSWLLDIWIAGKFGFFFDVYIEKCKVEIDVEDSQSYYDFKLHLNETQIPFQATETVETERRRGAEYKKGETLFDQPYWQESSIEPYEYVGRTIKNKLKKYTSGASDINLVVYANLFGFNEEYSDVVQHCKADIEQFKSVWLFSTYVFGALHENERKFYLKDDWIKLPQI